MLAGCSDITGAACILADEHHLFISSVCTSVGGRLTGMVPAAPSGASSPPRAVEIHGVPVA